MEAFAGMLTHTDAQIGRLIDYLEQSDQLDNTIIVFLSDNGASAEGGVYGRFNAMSGQRFGGSSFYIKDNRLKYVYNANKFQYFEAVSDIEIPVGDVKLSYSYEYDDSDNTALATIYINDK